MPDLWFHRGRAAGVLDVKGEDAPRFLQGQGTADLGSGVGSSTRTLWLDHRGKVQGDAHVLQVASERFVLVSLYTPADVLRARFDSFIVADDVEVKVREEDALLTVGGADMEFTLVSAGIALPAKQSFSLLDTDMEGRALAPPALIFRAPRGVEDSVDCLLGAMEADRLSTRLAAYGVRELSSAELEARRIAAGIPAVPRDVGPAETPFEGGLGELVSLTKGCFLGQEVVARQARLERFSRKLVRASCGEKINTGQVYPVFQDGNEVGELRSAVYDDSRVIGLAMVKRSAAEAGGRLALGDAEGPVLEIEDSHAHS